MRKKIIVCLLLLALVPSFVMADFMSLGLNVGYSKSYTDIHEPANTEFWDWRNISYGPELRINIFFLRLSLASHIAPLEEGVLFDNTAAVDLYFKFLDSIRLSLGVGVSMPIYQKGGDWHMGYGDVAFTDFKGLMESSHLTYRVGLGYIFDNFEIDLQYSLPARGSFKEGDYVPSWEDSTLSLGLSVILF